MQTSATIGAIAKAFAAAQGELENVTKDRENPFYNAKYATLAAVLDEVRPVLAKNGIGVVQSPGTNDKGQITVTTTLVHESGEWMQSCFVVPTSKNDAQGVGSAISYGRRYSLAAMCGVAQEDDDANAAAASTGATQDRQGAQNGATRQPHISTVPVRPTSTETLADRKQAAAKVLIQQLADMNLLHEERELVAQIDNDLPKIDNNVFGDHVKRIRAMHEAFTANKGK